MNDVIKTVPSLEKSGLLIDDASETAKPEIKKKQEGRFLPAVMAPIAALLIALMVYSLIQPVAFSLINTLTGKGVRREGKGQESAICLLLTLPLVMKSMSGRRYDKMDQMDKNL